MAFPLGALYEEHARRVDASFLGEASQEDLASIQALELQIETAEASDYADAITQQRARADKAAGLAREVQALLALAAEHGLYSRRRRIVPRASASAARAAPLVTK